MDLAIRSSGAVGEAGGTFAPMGLEQGVSGAESAKPLVMIADDDELLQQLVSHKLAQRGCETLCVDNGEQLLAAVAARMPNLIVLDAMMPIMDGFETLRRLRAARATAAIPVLMLTARRGEQDVVAALNLGASDYLAKPFMPEELALRVRALLEKAARA